jgi:hypothetical protein
MDFSEMPRIQGYIYLLVFVCTWKLHMAYHTQSSGKMECMNRFLETHLQWDQLLHIALPRIRSSPRKWMGLSPFAVLYGCPFPLVTGIRGDLKEIGELTLSQQMQALGLTLSKINDWVWERLPISLTPI